MNEISYFRKMLEAKWQQGKYLCVGLDPQEQLLPTTFMSDTTGSTYEKPIYRIREFCKKIVLLTNQIAAAYKLNIAFFEAYGSEGIKCLLDIVMYIQHLDKSMPIIIDAKRGDIGSTNNGYVEFMFDWLRADAVTVHPYLGRESLLPMLDITNKGIIILAKTSNKGAGEFQDLRVRTSFAESLTIPVFRTWLGRLGYEGFIARLIAATIGEPLSYRVARNVATSWNVANNCGLVVGATYPCEIRAIRYIVGDSILLLIPGIGAQGGDLHATVQGAWKNFLINVSRGIIHASRDNDWEEVVASKAKFYHEAIQEELLLMGQWEKPQ
ncbi:orotidine-5'-phosphate decarboxylase [Patescibacteria group bacterium]